MMRGRGRAIAAALVLAGSAPVAAQLRLPETPDAQERALLPEIGAALGSGHPTLPQLDALLAKLPRPGAVRGVVQMARATVLAQANDYPRAAVAAEEAARLLPDQPHPKLLLSFLLTFSGAPQRAADLWMEASHQAPEVARETDTYTLGALIGRLNDMGDTRRARMVAARMGEVGLAHHYTSDTDAMAAAQVRQHLDKGDLDNARRALVDVTAPATLIGMYVDQRYQPLWPSVEAQGGAGFAEAQRRYFTAVRGEWQRGRDYETAVNYARVLASVHAYSAVLNLFEPMFVNMSEHLDDAYLWLLAPVVARSMAETGRIADGRALLARLDAAPMLERAMQLNASGNLANLSFLLHRWDDVIRETASWLKVAAELGPSVNRSAVLQVSAVRACALTRSGRANEAAALVGDLLIAQRASPQPALTFFLCTGDVTKARALLIDRLADEDSRTWALMVAQPDDRSGSLPEEVEQARVLAEVRNDPAVRGAVAKVGRLLPVPAARTLPEGFEPDGSDRPIRLRPGSA